MTTAPVIPAATKRAIDDWTARGLAVEVVTPDGTVLRVTPQVPQDDRDLIQWKRK